MRLVTLRLLLLMVVVGVMLSLAMPKREVIVASNLAIAASPSVTATATPSATPTPVPACIKGESGDGVHITHCEPLAASTTAGQVESSVGVDRAGNALPPAWTSQPFTIGWDGYLGIVTNAATKTIVAPCTGHFTSLSCDAALTGTCTTVPVINVDNVTTPATGTAINLTTTVGTPVTHAETLTFVAGNIIGLAQTASPATCTVPWWGCEATLSCP